MDQKTFQKLKNNIEELELKLGIDASHIYPLSKMLNRYDLTSVIVSMNDDNVVLANELWNLLKENCVMSSFTRSKGLSRRDWMKPRFWMEKTSSTVQLIYSVHHVVSIIFSSGTIRSENDITGRDSFNRFCSILNSFKIDINDYAANSADEAIAIKQSIEKPYIGCANKFVADPTGKKLPFQHCYHIDINSAFMSGVALNYPALEKPIRFIYNKRKEDPMCKQILNLACGFCQSRHTRGVRQLTHEHRFQFALSKISQAALFYTNRYIERKSRALTDAKYLVLAYNTDGIWYSDIHNLGPYHDEEEGIQLGQWKTDHSDCVLRFKSDGVYEYIEDGKYNCVVRGRTHLDDVKPRTEWQWGDIYLNDAKIQKYGFNPTDGFYINDEEIGGIINNG